MSDYRLPCDHDDPAYRDELDQILRLKISPEGIEERRYYFERYARIARRLPRGYIKKIVWDEAGGYPSHAWGYIQYSPRPYHQGYGCDGTTDRNIHLIGLTLCDRLGLDYPALHRLAYPDLPAQAGSEDWGLTLRHDSALLTETLIPHALSRDSLRLLLYDLYQINNRSFVEVLETAFEECGYPAQDWSDHEERLRPAMFRI